MFKFSLGVGVVASVLFCAGMTAAPALAGDDLVEVPIADALATPEFKEALDGSVSFYFGDTAHPAVAHMYGDFVANEKTNGFGKGPMMSCERAMLSALIKFQKRAQQLGANAVINIHSYYKREDVSSNTSVQCYDGFLMSGVALKGDFVKLGGH